MNLSLGELEFNLSKNNVDKLLKSTSNIFFIMSINSDGSRSTMYQGNYIF